MEVSNMDRRLNFKVAEQICKDNGIVIANARPAYSFLRIEVQLIDTVSNYVLPIGTQTQYNGSFISPTEQRLAQQDNFVVGSMGMFVYFLDRRGNIPASDLVTYFGPHNTPNAYRYGNPNPLYSGVPITTLPGFPNQIWQAGQMKFTMDQNVILPYYDCLQHYYVPREQGTLASDITGTSDPTVDPYYGYPWRIPQFNGLSDGFMPMEPNIVLSGARNNEITYRCNTPINFTNWGWVDPDITDGIVEPRLVFFFRGVLLQNTTNVK